MRATVSVVVVLSGIMLVVGCSKSDAPVTARVKGTVNYQGKPVPDATLLFVPDKGPPAFGKTDSAGNFELTTKSPNDGAAVGTHKVSVTKIGPPGGMTEEQYQKLKASAGAGTQVPAGVSLIPEKYSRTETTTLTATIEAGKTNEISLKLD